MPVSSDDFRAALSRFPSGVTVVTTRDAAGKMHGLTVSAFCSVSLEPPLVLICIEKIAGSHYAFLESGVFAVSMLGVEQRELSERFAAQHDEKLDGVEFIISELGVPLLAGCVGNLECRVKRSYDGGDHTIFVGEVENVTEGFGDPLVYFRSRYGSFAE